MTSNSNLKIITLLCYYADELLELVEFIEYCFPNIQILTLEDKNFLEQIKEYKKLLEISDKLKMLDSVLQKRNI